MNLVGICSVKGAPGATTLATALAVHGRAFGAVLVEADPAGGDLALRYGISQTPGLAALAARARHSADPGRDVFGDLARPSEPGGFTVIPAPVEPTAAAAALTTLGIWPTALADAARSRPVLMDFGRVDPQIPSRGFIEACDVLCLVVRGDAVSLGHAREASWLTKACARVGFVLVDTGPYRAREAADALALPCLGTVPFHHRRPRSKRVGKAVRTLWDDLFTPSHELMTAPELEQVSPR